MNPSGSGPLAALAGFRDSPARPIGNGEVVASTYAVRDEIARTDNGIVFEARDMLLDRTVAFKLGWRDPGSLSLVAEARRCAAVVDPCAVQVHAMGTHNGVEYAVGERVQGRLLRDELKQRMSEDLYLARLRTLTGAVSRAHEAGIAVGDISGSTVLVVGSAAGAARGRLVLGRLSLSQIPAFGPHGQILAPEVVRGEITATDPQAAEAIDLYGLGCIAIEMASGTAPFEHADPAACARGHAFDTPPRLAELRPELPAELSDLVDWLLAKHPAARPRSARDVLAQLDTIIERLGNRARTVRVLIVDDDSARARWLWSLARRAHAAAIVEIAGEGTEAAHKLNRDLPDVVFVDAGLRGVMNALELVMYARGLDGGGRGAMFVVGDISDRDRAMFVGTNTSVISDDARLANEILDKVRAAMVDRPRRAPRTTISG